MQRLPVFRIEGKGWWQQDMKTLRERAIRATEGPVQLTLETAQPKADGDSLYLPCRFCDSTRCLVAVLKPGAVDNGYPFPWTRRYPPPTTARIQLTPCEEKELREIYAAMHIKLPEPGQPKAAAEPVKPKPVLTSRQTAERLLEACHAKRGRTVERLCELAGIDVTEVVGNVLDFLKTNGRIVRVMRDRWILA